MAVEQSYLIALGVWRATGNGALGFGLGALTFGLWPLVIRF
jgi:hypothetical protein